MDILLKKVALEILKSRYIKVLKIFVKFKKEVKDENKKEEKEKNEKELKEKEEKELKEKKDEENIK